MKRSWRMGRVLIVAGAVLYFSCGIGAAASLQSVKEAPSRAGSWLAHETAIGFKDLLLQTIDIGHGILIGTAKFCSEIAEATSDRRQASKC